MKFSLTHTLGDEKQFIYVTFLLLPKPPPPPPLPSEKVTKWETCKDLKHFLSEREPEMVILWINDGLDDYLLMTRAQEFLALEREVDRERVSWPQRSHYDNKHGHQNSCSINLSLDLCNPLLYTTLQSLESVKT